MCETNNKKNLYVLNGSTVRTGIKEIWVSRVCATTDALAQGGATSTNMTSSSIGGKLKVEMV